MGQSHTTCERKYLLICTLAFFHESPEQSILSQTMNIEQRHTAVRKYLLISNLDFLHETPEQKKAC